MAKILTDKECAQIIWDAVNDPGVIDCSAAYGHFLEDLGDLIASHFGGDRGFIGEPDLVAPDNPRISDPEYEDCLGWTIAFDINDCVPSDGGVFKDYDTDVTWVDGKVLDE